MTDEQKQKIKDYQKQYRENMTDEEKQKHKKNIYQKSKNKKEEIIKNNEMQANADKCHVLISTDQKLHVNIGTLQIENSKCEKRLGVNIDSKLSFEKHYMWQSQGKNKCLRKSSSIYEYSEKKNDYECIFQFSV